jgi:NAD(P)H-hydrate epimerase
MNLPPLSREKVRRIDRIATEQYGIPGVVLMENAGRGAAEVIQSVAPSGKLTILCGKGNNAGDGYVIARHLDLLGRQVRLISIVDTNELGGDAAVNASIARRAELDLVIANTSDSIRHALADASIVVDCLLGTGATGELKQPFSLAVEEANALPATRIAIDVPTGLDCDTGQPHPPTFRADHTISFVAEKLGLRNKDADQYVGQIHVVGIGVPRHLLQQFCD